MSARIYPENYFRALARKVKRYTIPSADEWNQNHCNDPSDCFSSGFGVERAFINRPDISDGEHVLGLLHVYAWILDTADDEAIKWATMGLMEDAGIREGGRELARLAWPRMAQAVKVDGYEDGSRKAVEAWLLLPPEIQRHRFYLPVGNIKKLSDLMTNSSYGKVLKSNWQEMCDRVSPDAEY